MALGTNIGRGIRMMFIGILTSKISYPIQNRHFKIVVIYIRFLAVALFT